MYDKTERSRFGERLRAVRRAQSLSLSDVEEATDGEFKAVVLGSYERGVRAMTMDKCSALATFYKVPVSIFFNENSDDKCQQVHQSSGVICDLKLIRNRALNDLRHDLDRYRPLAKYLEQLCRNRGDWNGEVLSIRNSDTKNLELILGLSEAELRDWLNFEGIILQAKKV